MFLNCIALKEMIIEMVIFQYVKALSINKLWENSVTKQNFNI